MYDQDEDKDGIQIKSTGKLVTHKDVVSAVLSVANSTEVNDANEQHGDVVFDSSCFAHTTVHAESKLFPGGLAAVLVCIIDWCGRPPLDPSASAIAQVANKSVIVLLAQRTGAGSSCRPVS
ncbi:uncharacterized protein V6R79_006490 [Siganus canaliculatus]